MRITFYLSLSWFFMVLITCCLMSSALASDDKYAYPNIIKEYEERSYRQDGMTSPDYGKTGVVCGLDKPISLTDAVIIALKNNPDNQMALARI